MIATFWGGVGTVISRLRHFCDVGRRNVTHNEPKFRFVNVFVSHLTLLSSLLSSMYIDFQPLCVIDGRNQRFRH